MKTSKSLTPTQIALSESKKPFVVSDQMLLEEALMLIDDYHRKLDKLDLTLDRSIQGLDQLKAQTSARANLEHWFEEVMQ